MRPGRLARACIRVVERYQRSDGARANDKSCAFDPSCSAFIEEAFRTRSFLVAFHISFWRMLRCNRLLGHRAHDPVHRRTWRPRPNMVRTSSRTGLIGGVLFLAFSAAAYAQGVSGGCSAFLRGANGTDVPAEAATSNSPVVVDINSTAGVRGFAPDGTPQDTTSLTTITVSIIEQVVEPQSENHPGTGALWGGEVRVEPYARWGTGLYLVTGTSNGSSPSGSSFSCEGSGYYKVSGNPLSAPIGQVAAGLIVVGAATNLLSRRAKDVATAPVPAPPPSPSTGVSDSELMNPYSDFYTEEERQCCFLLMLAAVVMPIVGAGGGATPVGQSVVVRHAWRRGRPFLGFLTALLFGLGFTVLMQQYAVWPLTVTTAIVLPLVIAVLGGIRAYVGQRVRIVTRARPRVGLPPATPVGPPPVPPPGAPTPPPSTFTPPPRSTPPPSSTLPPPITPPAPPRDEPTPPEPKPLLPPD